MKIFLLMIVIESLLTKISRWLVVNLRVSKAKKECLSELMLMWPNAEHFEKVLNSSGSLL